MCVQACVVCICTPTSAACACTGVCMGCVQRAHTHEGTHARGGGVPGTYAPMHGGCEHSRGTTPQLPPPETQQQPKGPTMQSGPSSRSSTQAAVNYFYNHLSPMSLNTTVCKGRGKKAKSLQSKTQTLNAA